VRDVFKLLAASGLFAEHRDRLLLYGQFVGAWDVDVTWDQPDEGLRKGNGILPGCSPRAMSLFICSVAKGARIVQEGIAPDHGRLERWSSQT
jgi:hypothetical protein